MTMVCVGGQYYNYHDIFKSVWQSYPQLHRLHHCKGLPAAIIVQLPQPYIMSRNALHTTYNTYT